jgi:predicted Fe-Mo cluster-binding NifX family protein
MKIAICSTGTTQDAQVSSRYARSEYFMIYDRETLTYSFIENNAKNEASGAGGKATKLLSDKDVQVVLVPQLGPKAFDAFKAFEIEAFEYNKTATVHETLYAYFAKELRPVTEAKGKGKH